MSRAAKAALDAQNKQNADVKASAGAAAANEGVQAGNVAGEAGAIAPDLTPEQREAYLRAKVGSISTGYEAARGADDRSAARTGAVAGVAATDMQSRRNEINDKAAAGGQASLDLANEPIARANARAALYGQAGGLYGNQASPYTSMYGSGTNLSGELSKSAFAPGLGSTILTNAMNNVTNPKNYMGLV